MNVDRWFYSYEGEGDLVGIKTLFCSYPGSTSFNSLDRSGVGAVFINAKFLDEDLVEGANLLETVTIEIEADAFLQSCPTHELLCSDVRLFVVCDFDVPLPPFNGFVKVRVLKLDRLQEKLALANTFASRGFKVLLMPEFLHDFPEALGKSMQRIFDRVRPEVRVAPPLQYLLRMK